MTGIETILAAIGLAAIAVILLLTFDKASSSDNGARPGDTSGDSHIDPF